MLYPSYSMTGKVCPKYTAEQLREFKRRAVELRLQGYRPREIKSILGTRHSAGTISRWLKRSGLIPSTVDRVLELDEDGLTVDEIRKKLRISKRRTLSILQQKRGKKRSRKTPEQNADIFLADPEGCMNERFTRSFPFCWALIKKCLKVVDDNPIIGREVVSPTVKLLTSLRSVRRTPETRRQATCLLFQGVSLDLHMDMVTSDPKLALEKLESASWMIEGCDECAADFYRRLSLAYAHLELYDMALKANATALLQYKALSSAGHDLYGNGIANCYLARSAIRNLCVSPEAGAADARSGLRLASPKDSLYLYGLLILALAVCLKNTKGLAEVSESRRLLESAMIFFDSDVPTITRAHIRWLDGLLAMLEGNPLDAEILLRHAREDAWYLKLETEVTAITADLGAINPHPYTVTNQVNELLVYDWTVGRKVLPDWLSRDLQDALHEVHSAAQAAQVTKNSVDASVFQVLRDTAAQMPGSQLIPAFGLHSVI